MEDSYSIVQYTIFLLIVIGISIAVKYVKNRNLSREKDYISKVERIDSFEYVINKYLEAGYKLKAEEKEELILEKNEILNYMKDLYFKEGHEIKSKYVKSEDEYIMTQIYLFYDKKLYDYYDLEKEGSIQKLDVENGIEIIKTPGGAEYDEEGNVKVDADGKVVFKPDKENKVPFTKVTYQLNKRGIVKYKIYLASLEYFKNIRIREDTIDSIKKDIDNKSITRISYDW